MPVKYSDKAKNHFRSQQMPAQLTTSSNLWLTQPYTQITNHKLLSSNTTE